MLRVAVLASGRGTNFQALHDACTTGYADAEIVCVATNRPQAGVLERAAAAGVDGVVVASKGIASREAYDNELLDALEPFKADLVCGSGFMRIFSPVFIGAYRDNLLNVHPSLLPAFPGTHVIEEAWNWGAKVTGVTVHLMTEDLDSGPVVYQRALDVDASSTVEDLERRIHLLEYALYPKALKLFAEGSFRIDGRRVVIERDVEDPPWAGELPPGLAGDS
ncbi:MAG: phosphoribosylglycinamide formyltransferase [Actinomycetota bacterium]